MGKGIEITLPVIRRSKLTGKAIKRRYREEKFVLDMSLAAEMRFEQKFPVEYKAYGDLQQFMERVCAIEEISRAKIATMLKCVYCFFDTKYTLLQFMQLFDLTDLDYIGRLVEKLKVVFGVIKESASEKN